MVARQSLTPYKGSRLFLKCVKVMFYINNPVVRLVASMMNGNPLGWGNERGATFGDGVDR